MPAPGVIDRRRATRAHQSSMGCQIPQTAGILSGPVNHQANALVKPDPGPRRSAARRYLHPFPRPRPNRPSGAGVGYAFTIPPLSFGEGRNLRGGTTSKGRPSASWPRTGFSRAEAVCRGRTVPYFIRLSIGNGF